MKRALLIILVVSLLMASSCTAKVSKGKVTSEHTQSVAKSPTEEPTPESTATNEPTATIEPAPTTTPALEPDIMPSEAVESIEELFDNAPYSDLPVYEAPKIRIPDSYLGDGTPGDFSLHDFAVMDDEGNLYYTNFREIKKIDAATGKRTVVFSWDDYISDSQNRWEYTRLWPYNLYFKDGKLYAAAEYEYDEYQYRHFMLDIFEWEFMYYTDDYFYAAYDSRTIKKYYDDDLGRTVYNQYTLRGNVARGEVTVTNGYNYLELKYVSDKYLFFVAQKFFYDEDNNRERKTKFVIVDKATMVVVDTTFEDEFDFYDKDIILCKDSWMMFFDRSDSAIKLYNIKNGAISTYWDFGGENKYLGYDAEEHCVYIRKSLYYTHLIREDEPGSPHYNAKDCISSNESDNATELFLKCNLLTFEVERLGTVKTMDYLDEYSCPLSLNEYIVGDYVVVYSIYMEGESNTPYIYDQAFKLGEDIDYDTWRD